MHTIRETLLDATAAVKKRGDVPYIVCTDTKAVPSGPVVHVYTTLRVAAHVPAGAIQRAKQNVQRALQAAVPQVRYAYMLLLTPGFGCVDTTGHSGHLASAYMPSYS